MDPIISFAHMTPALLAGAKTVIRRSWRRRYAERFQLAGDLVRAYDRSPRKGGQHVANLQVLSVTYEPDSLAPDLDYEAEGFAWLRDHPEYWPVTLNDRPFDPWRLSWEWFSQWRLGGGASWVIRFRLLDVVAQAPWTTPGSVQAPVAALGARQAQVVAEGDAGVPAAD